MRRDRDQKEDVECFRCGVTRGFCFTCGKRHEFVFRSGWVGCVECGRWEISVYPPRSRRGMVPGTQRPEQT